MKRIFYFLLAGLLVIACSKPKEDGEEDAYSKLLGSIAGRVYDQTTNESVSVATVSLSPGGNTTGIGTDGLYHFKGLEPGEYTVAVSKEGYTSNARQVTVHQGKETPADLAIGRLPAKLTADREEVDFGDKASVTTLSFEIVNKGYTDLRYRVEKGSCEWIEVTPETDTLCFGKTAVIVVTIDREKLDNGENEAIIVVHSTNGGGNVEVTVKAIGAHREKATLNTLAATNISETTATLNGEIILSGVPAYTECGFAYAPSPHPEIGKNGEQVTAPISSQMPFSSFLKELSPATTYYARAYLIQNGESIYGNEIHFVTLEQTPYIVTEAVTKIGTTEVTLNASIPKAGVPAFTERGFCYSRTEYPTISDNRIKCAGNGTGNFGTQATGLEYPATYHVRAYVIQSGKPIYGNNVSFTKAYEQALVRTLRTESVGLNTARFNAQIVKTGLPAYTERGFCYSAQHSEPTIADKKVSSTSSSEGNYYIDVKDLKSGTTYYVRPFLIQDKELVYGEPVYFTTLLQPIVQTDNVTTERDETNTNWMLNWRAFLHGSVITDGLPPSTRRGFVYSFIFSNPTVGLGDTVYVPGNGCGTFSTIIEELFSGKSYYVRAFAETELGYVYGETVRFSTYE